MTKTVVIKIRATPEELIRWRRVSTRDVIDGLRSRNLSEWGRLVLNKRCQESEK